MKTSKMPRTAPVSAGPPLAARSRPFPLQEVERLKDMRDAGRHLAACLAFNFRASVALSYFCSCSCWHTTTQKQWRKIVHACRRDSKNVDGSMFGNRRRKNGSANSLEIASQAHCCAKRERPALRRERQGRRTVVRVAAPEHRMP